MGGVLLGRKLASAVPMKSSSSPEGLPSNRITAVQELTQGQPLIDKLRAMLPLPEKIDADITSIDNVVVQILEMFDNTLSVLSSCGPNKFPRIPTSHMGSPSSWDGWKSQDFDKGLTAVIPVRTKRGCYKRRKNSWTSTTVTSILTDDGHAWRKYGQKAILNAKHQRNYYRCTHKFDQRCQATKQIQKIEDEPPRYMITYNGHHTCKNLLRAPQIILDSPNSKDTSILLSFESKTTIEKKQPDRHFPLKKNGPKESFPPLGLSHDQSSSSDHHLSWDPIMQASQVPLEPVISMMSSGLDHGDMISRVAYSPLAIPYSCDYEIDDMFGNNGFIGFPSELCS